MAINPINFDKSCKLNCVEARPWLPASRFQNDHLKVESDGEGENLKEDKRNDSKAKGGYLDDLDLPPSESEEYSEDE